MSAGFFKTRDHQLQKKAKKAQTSQLMNVVSLFPQKEADLISIQRILQRQREKELENAVRLQNSIRALLQRTHTAAPRSSLFRAPKPTPKTAAISKKELLDKLAKAPTPDSENNLYTFKF